MLRLAKVYLHCLATCLNQRERALSSADCSQAHHLAGWSGVVSSAKDKILRLEDGRTGALWLRKECNASAATGEQILDILQQAPALVLGAGALDQGALQVSTMCVLFHVPRFHPDLALTPALLPALQSAPKFELLEYVLSANPVHRPVGGSCRRHGCVAARRAGLSL